MRRSKQNAHHDIRDFFSTATGDVWRYHYAVSEKNSRCSGRDQGREN
jgi:hypothetical protein